MFFGSRLLTAAAGAVLLVAGRRVYWLVVGLVGFVVGFTLAAEYLEGPDWLILVAGLGTGLLASGLAVFFQKVAITVAGFLIGGLAVLVVGRTDELGRALVGLGRGAGGGSPGRLSHPHRLRSGSGRALLGSGRDLRAGSVAATDRPDQSRCS